jgi:hypothetical protein
MIGTAVTKVRAAKMSATSSLMETLVFPTFTVSNMLVLAKVVKIYQEARVAPLASCVYGLVSPHQLLCQPTIDLRKNSLRNQRFFTMIAKIQRV